MENASVIRFGTYSYQPEVEDKYGQWLEAAYAPVLIKTRETTGLDMLHIVKESPEYGKYGTMTHFRDVVGSMNVWNRPVMGPMVADQRIWTGRPEFRRMWWTLYRLMRGFRNAESGIRETELTTVDGVSILHFEAFDLPPELQEKYSKWFDEYGFKFFIPLLMKSPGLKAYNYYDWTGVRLSRESKEPGYPLYLSLMYFEDLSAFERYDKSRERAVFEKTVRADFPNLSYKWYVQYHITKAFRK